MNSKKMKKETLTEVPPEVHLRYLYQDKGI